MRMSRPSDRSEHLRQILLAPVFRSYSISRNRSTLVSRTLLRSVGDVFAVGRIERCRVARGIVGGDVLGLYGRDARTYTDDPDVVVRRGRFDFVVIRGVGDFLSVGREGVVVLSAKREGRRIVVAGREVVWCGG